MNQIKEAVHPAAGSRRWPAIWLYVVVVTLIAGAAWPANASGRLIAHNTPRYVFTAKNLGTEEPSKTIEVSIWLNPHNRGELDALAEQLYDRTSPNYRHFLNRAQFAARFAPTVEEAKTVGQFFEAHNLKVVKVGPDNFFVRARGTVGEVENALHVQLNNYQVLGKTIRANDRDPYVDGAAAPLVMAISGLDDGKYEHPMMSRSASLPQGKGAAAKASAVGATPDDLGYSNICFDGTVTQTYSNNGDGSFPIGTYKGNHLNVYTLTSAGCGYTPPMIQTAYNLTGLYAEGFDGTGQTIGILIWCGSLTIQNDANVFSAQFGLPPLTSSNFAITYLPTASVCETADFAEVNIDVEWAHAIAPGANINLIIAPSSLVQDVDEAEFTAVNYGLANVISGSFNAVESLVPANILATENLIQEAAAVAGISANFSSGDGGDYTGDGIPATVSTPADSPWATAVGGVTLALNPDNSIAWQAGWGNNETQLAGTGSVFDPPSTFGFISGSGGGPSNCAFQDDNVPPNTPFICLAGFPKPSYQKKLPGKYRQLPDVSWLADPFTGAVIAITVPNYVPSLEWQVWGGTSVSCPMFSALWAIANQEAGAPLGQAAPYLYSMPAEAVYDIVPLTSKANVTASIQESTGTNKYTAAQVAGVSSGKFISAIWDDADYQDTAYAISFGTDSGLKTAKGWDNVTGVGTPNAKAFADSFRPAAQ
jgi:subtilase family serine protease